MRRPDPEREQRMKEAEELLFGGDQPPSFAKGLFLGKCVEDRVRPYPKLGDAEANDLAGRLEKLRAFLDKEHHPDVIDREADIPRKVIDGLGAHGVMGMTAPKAVGGCGFSQLAYGQVLEEIGRRCAATSIFVNAHHSIGMRALLLFGTEDQKKKWLPKMVSGEHLGAFALTEPEAGSDAASVRTTATPSADGSHYVLDGEKRYITNGAIAQVLTVMARTPVEGSDKTEVTAFLVTPDMPGFKVVEARMEKLGIRGTATAKLAFEKMKVPKENVLGRVGKGLRLALTVLDFGRTTFGACCTGAAKTCMDLAVAHARSRRQFGQAIGEFDLVRKKIGNMAASIYAMEAMTTVTASLIDRGLEDYMLETAMLKVFTTEELWEIVNESFQIHGGAAYFTDRPLERLLRDARINQIGEGANEVLTSFIALVGMRGPGMQLKEAWEALQHPFSRVRHLWRFGLQRTGAALRGPEVPVDHAVLRSYASTISSLIRQFDSAIRRALIRNGEEVLEMQLVHERIARAGMELFASCCALSRWDAELAQPGRGVSDEASRIPELFLKRSARRIRAALAGLTDNDDAEIEAAAAVLLDEDTGKRGASG